MNFLTIWSAGMEKQYKRNSAERFGNPWRRRLRGRSREWLRLEIQEFVNQLQRDAKRACILSKARRVDVKAVFFWKR
mgnify:CR=1 FL=1